MMEHYNRRFHPLVVVLLVCLLAYSSRAASGPLFDQNYQVDYGNQNVASFGGGQRIQLSLDHVSGSGFWSRNEYYSGTFEMRIKFPAFSSGVVTSFYLTDNGQGPHEELDFEFIVDDNILQTNVFANGVGNREQRIHLWFDPSADFHTYKFIRNPNIIVFYVDGIPIRVFRNDKKDQLPFLTQPLRIQASIWDASWTGEVNRSKAPFKAQYKDFGIDGCVSSRGAEGCASPDLPWNKKQNLNPEEERAYQNMRSKYMFYDYCDDANRKPQFPLECKINAG